MRIEGFVRISRRTGESHIRRREAEEVFPEPERLLNHQAIRTHRFGSALVPGPSTIATLANAPKVRAVNAVNFALWKVLYDAQLLRTEAPF